MTTETPSSTSAERYLEVQNSAEFAGLRKSLRSFVFPMTAAFFLWYALYVLLSAYARGFMGVKLIGNINVALVLGLLQFVSTFAIAYVYAKYADKNLDPVADKIRGELDGAVSATSTGTTPIVTPHEATTTGTTIATTTGTATTTDTATTTGTAITTDDAVTAKDTAPATDEETK